MAPASSPAATESIFALEDPSPNRLAFDLERVMRTPYRIDDFQQVYFVIPSLQALLDATLSRLRRPLRLAAGPRDIPIDAILPSDSVLARGTQAYARSREDLARLVVLPPADGEAIARLAGDPRQDRDVLADPPLDLRRRAFAAAAGQLQIDVVGQVLAAGDA